MRSQSKIALLAVLSLVVLAAAFQWQKGGKIAVPDAPTADAARTNETVTRPEPTASTSSGSVDVKPTESPSQSLPDSSATAATTNEIADKVTPFAVEPNDGDTETAVAVSASNDAANRLDATDDGGAAVTSGQTIVVPSSYPVADAEKYFIPKAQRSPGNLGGPPPMNFPGGPSDPNRAQPGTDGVFTPPPPAPGQ